MKGIQLLEHLSIRNWSSFRSEVLHEITFVGTKVWPALAEIVEPGNYRRSESIEFSVALGSVDVGRTRR